MSVKNIEIRRKQNKTNLPDHLYEDSVKSIGASLGASGEVSTGLTIEETEKFMPSIVAISSTSQTFYKAVEDYFASLTMKVPTSGIKLDITLKPDGFPVNVQDYVHYKFAQANPKVAKDQYNMGIVHQYFFYDPTEETTRKFNTLQTKKNAEKEFIKLSADSKKMSLVLTILDPYALNLSAQEQELRLDKIKTNDVDVFLATCTDEHLETRAFLEKCISSQALRRVGNIILNGDEKLGDTIEQTIMYLEDAKNSEVVATLKARTKLFK